ncbi:glycosyltransferase family 2 protein [Bradyrhizobium sp. 930_D9_N1_4]|uniref:glycosyltransferase family 2 protein n=1 Tax=Bradyrhizobium sp. 930_D9_N1_4 TaxID=3240374 RepID=UPI003F8C5787
MQDAPARDGGESPLFSIIIPLDDHRGQWRQSWLGWTSQNVDRRLYEIILIVPPDLLLRADIEALTGTEARLEYSESVHDVELSALGAARARGRYLFFTESHCRPEPDVLALCIRAIEDHPDWSGFSCKSVPICHNVLSRAEAAMYQSDIEFGMKLHPWLKVLDQCFVTRRDVYEECGGLRTDLGHFAEWVLAASYYARGHMVGYLDEARVHHYYVGKLDELEIFTLDFVQGEIRYLSEARRDPGGELIEIPIEWSERDKFDFAIARHALNALVRYSLAGRGWKRPDEMLQAFRRWAAPALLNEVRARLAARIAVLHARTSLTVLSAVGASAATGRWMKRYIASLIRFQRLDCIRRICSRAGPPRRLFGDCVLAQIGFHCMESSAGSAFCWSEPEAAVRIAGASGRNIVRILGPALRASLDQIGVYFYLDGTLVDSTAIVVGRDSFTLRVDLPPSGIATLAWVCPVLRGVGDSRRLGLSIAAIEVARAEKK